MNHWTGTEGNQLDHPADNSLSRDQWERMTTDPRVLSGEWSHEDWLWEEVRQLMAVIRMGQQ